MTRVIAKNGSRKADFDNRKCLTKKGNRINCASCFPGLIPKIFFKDIMNSLEKGKGMIRFYISIRKNFERY